MHPMSTLQEQLQLYHDAICKAREMGLMIPTVVEVADLLIFPAHPKVPTPCQT
jgi:hypothetical protein